MRFIGILMCLASVIWGYFEYQSATMLTMLFGPLIGFLTGLSIIITTFDATDAILRKLLSMSTSEDGRTARDAHNRQAMLNRVQDFWVKGVLESSLHEEARIELGLAERRNAVAERPWDVILRTPDRPDCTLPPGTKISDVFERVGRSLLILGEQGAGKTTTLLELAREMIDRAGEDPSEKIPVVFNLSSWTDPKQTIADWLTEELREKYNIPKKIAAPWVENDSLLLLLDGLDEVAPERRPACIEAINGFLEEHFVPLVVCCRKEEYDSLDGRLNLQSAVLLQSLTPEQIDGYLERLSPDLNALREVLKGDQMLQEFAKTPLILSIMTLAYRGIPVEELQSLCSTGDHRRHLFKTYVDRMFERTVRTDPKLYPKEDTIHWLSWLARKMSEHGQTIFLIERMQPKWLETKVQKKFYYITSTLIGGLFGGLIGWLIGWIIVGTIGWMIGGMIAGSILGLFLGFSAEFGAGLVGGLIGGVLVGLMLGTIIGAIAGVIFGLFFGLTEGLSSILSSWLIVVLRGGLIGMLSGGLFGGLFFSGLAVVQHFALRFALHREGFLPWNQVSFLDYATDRIFLRKVGGGYVFVHSMLMEYFASLEPGPGRK